MNTVKIELNGKIFKGTLDFYVIRQVQEDLKENNVESKVHEIFLNISNLDKLSEYSTQYTLSSLLLYSILRVENITDKEFEGEFKLEKDSIKLFETIFTYINNLMKKCIQKSNEDESEFEEEYISNKDWNFAHMEYLWYSVLKRTDDFYRATPKMFFEQMDVLEEVNGTNKNIEVL
ncbi:hypothetical protein KWY38_04305 [Clostridioides difficile]|nr:hypothetical protein [Clostridioides difficile]